MGMAVVGFFAVCVLVYDMIMCGKDKGVLYKVKEKCCKSDQVDNKVGELGKDNWFYSPMDGNVNKNLFSAL